MSFLKEGFSPAGTVLLIPKYATERVRTSPRTHLACLKFELLRNDVVRFTFRSIASYSMLQSAIEVSPIELFGKNMPGLIAR